MFLPIKTVGIIMKKRKFQFLTGTKVNPTLIPAVLWLSINFVTVFVVHFFQSNKFNIPKSLFP